MTTCTLSLSTWKKTSISSWKKGKNITDSKVTSFQLRAQSYFCHVILQCVFITVGNVRIIWVSLSHYMSVFVFAETSCSLSQSSETWHFRYYRDCPLFINMVGDSSKAVQYSRKGALLSPLFCKMLCYQAVSIVVVKTYLNFRKNIWMLHSW